MNEAKVESLEEIVVQKAARKATDIIDSLPTARLTLEAFVQMIPNILQLTYLNSTMAQDNKPTQQGLREIINIVKAAVDEAFEDMLDDPTESREFVEHVDAQRTKRRNSMKEMGKTNVTED